MKNKKTKLSISLSVLFIGFLICSSSLNTLSTKALLEEKYNHYNIDSFDRFTWKWNTTEIVSTESTGLSYSPSLATDSTGTVYIAWGDETNYAGAGTDRDIFFKRWDSSSSSWTTTEVVSTEAETAGGSFVPSLAVDSVGNIHVAWESVDVGGTLSDHKISYKRWDAFTQSWTTTELVSTESTDFSGFPSLAIDSAGNVHVAWDDLTNYAGNGTDLDIFYKRWNSSSSTWTTTEVVSTESTEHSNNPSLAIDTIGNVHIAWDDLTNYAGSGTDRDIFYRRWDSLTSSWTTIEVVSTESTSESAYPSLAIDSAGNMHIAWYDFTDYAGSGTDRDIFYRRWDSSSSSWTVTEVVSTESTGISWKPTLAIDSAGNTHVAWEDWTDYTGAGTDPDIFYKRWDSSSSSWTMTEVVSTESTGISYYPSLATDSAGNVQIAWEDWTDYAGAGLDQDIFYKILTGPPAAPELAFIVPNPTELTNVYLDWNNVLGVTTYYVYRSTSYIWSVEGLIPITTVSSSDYIDTLSSEGFYYYVVVAENFAGNSSISNCQYVEVK
ncbi:MAG: hypothetical protein KAS63_01775, partial [Candidatus Heimdallarchaeota archaeon]|nr:hypothetical protein [Candidatus Heimdallarchaeota archaeon]MCK4954063.1 hypothetical protein [Candidatus Heimdallarchaeota archaeon]